MVLLRLMILKQLHLTVDLLLDLPELKVADLLSQFLILGLEVLDLVSKLLDLDLLVCSLMSHLAHLVSDHAYLALKVLDLVHPLKL